MEAVASLFGYLLNWLYQAFNNYGWAIIVFSVILRVILLPLTYKQQKTLKKSAKVQEKLKEIQEKYKNNQAKINEETINLYKNEKVSPFGGCLTGILQIFIIIAVFLLVSNPITYLKKTANDKYYTEEMITKIEQEAQSTIVEDNVENSENKAEKQEINKDITVKEYYTEQLQKESNNAGAYIEISIINRYGNEDERVQVNMDFLGLNLSKVPRDNMNDWTVYIIPVLYIISSLVSMKLTTALTSGKKKKSEKSEAEESAEQMTKSMNMVMPLMTVMIAFVAPLGLALYWLMSNILMIVERLVLNVIFKDKNEENDDKNVVIEVEKEEFDEDEVIKEKKNKKLDKDI